MKPDGSRTPPLSLVGEGSAAGPAPGSAVPVPLTAFIGRESALEEVGSLIRSSRLVTLAGPGGSGKTRLAIEAAGRAAGAFPDGVWWVDLSSIADPSLVVSATSEALGVVETPFRPSSGALRNRLRGAASLLVLDNCEHVVRACAELVDGLLRTCGELRVLATSREPLGVDGEVSWVVPPLSVPDTQDDPDELAQTESVRLFVDRATRVRPNFRLDDDVAPAVAEICRRLEGIPLAIELAAARTRVLSARRIAEGLSDAFHVLGAGSRTSAARQQTLRASVDWSYELLEEPERILLRRLAVFSGGFTLDAAEHACAGEGIDRLDVLEVLSKLVEKSLARPLEDGTATRYRLLETIRQYGLERLEESGEDDAIRDAHLRFFRNFVAEASEHLDAGEGSWLPRLEADHDNIRAALDRAASTGRSNDQLRMASNLWTFWGVRHLEEGRRRLEAAAATDATDDHARGIALVGASILAGNLFDLPASLAFGREALRRARAVGDREVEASALNQLGWASGWVEGDAARRHHHQAISVAREIGDERILALSLNGLGFLEFQSGNPSEARRLLEESLDVSRSFWATDLSPVGGIFGWLGLTMLLQGDLPGAKQHLEKALMSENTIGGGVFRSLWLSGLGLVSAFAGRYEEAKAFLDEGLRVTEEFGFPLGAAVPLWFTGMLEYWTNDLANARETLRRALELLGASGDALKWGVSMCRAILGHIAWLDGDRDEAMRHLDEALRVAREANIAAGKENALALRAIVTELDGDPEEAERLFVEALLIAMQSGGRPWATDCLEGLACLATQLGGVREAARLLGAAEAARDAMGYVRFPVYGESYARDVALIREELGTDAVNAWNEGRAMTTEQAVVLASKRRGPRRRPASGWASLTPVEQQVAKLVAERLTNPQIAERLFVSRGTVKTHLAHIYTKLGISSRLELADLVAKRAGMRPGERGG